MYALLLGLAIVAADLGIKWLLHRRLAYAELTLGRLGRLRTVPGRLWLVRATGGARVGLAFSLWALCAICLAVVGAWLPAARLPISLLLAGSVSNLLEHATRGAVTDYVCLRWWPAFNLADVALAAGAVSLLSTVAAAA